ncbi:hypothetical protein KUTeg_011691 [Tegillarca granosa]|uniref:Uncharacterized protein n=1 Tax=Tegillarca granosa TaxID=220873 RepID=A0ABQ9EZV0_TEGGR|nr:hypothetical protein KUTeg_011691 [Tegillarca granosa]
MIYKIYLFISICQVDFMESLHLDVKYLLYFLTETSLYWQKKTGSNIGFYIAKAKICSRSHQAENYHNFSGRKRQAPTLCISFFRFKLGQITDLPKYSWSMDSAAIMGIQILFKHFAAILNTRLFMYILLPSWT